MKIISLVARGPNTGQMTRLLKWANGAYSHTHPWTWMHRHLGALGFDLAIS
jgi:hypothetical protein